MSKKNKNNIREEKYISCCEEKGLVVKIDIVIFLPYFVEKVFLKLVQRFSSFGKLFQTDGAKKEIQF